VLALVSKSESVVSSTFTSCSAAVGAVPGAVAGAVAGASRPAAVQSGRHASAKRTQCDQSALAVHEMPSMHVGTSSSEMASARGARVSVAHERASNGGCTPAAVPPTLPPARSTSATP
jgi:hypothetical protein